MTDKVQKIHEKVEMVVNRRLNLLNGDYFDLNKETHGFTNEIIDIIDSLQKEPVNENLEEAVNAYIGYPPEVDESSSTYGKRQAFKAGAQWQKERMMKKACEWLEPVFKEYAGYYCGADLLNTFRKIMEG